MQHLFTEFSPVTREQWKEQIVKDLKGIDFNQLVWKTHNGFDISPFYTGEDLSSPGKPLFAHNDWDICEQITVTDEAEANRRALKALENGAGGLSFYIHKKINTAALIRDISLEHIYSQFFISNDALHVLNDLKAVYGKINPHDHKLKCYVHVDPLSLYAFYGEWHESAEKDLSVLRQLNHIPVNVSLYEEAGAGTVNELAIGLAHANEYLNYLSEQDDIKNKKALHFIFSVAPDFFTEIAKLRAWRKLIALLQQQYGIDLPVHIHAQTAEIDKSSMDAYTNMLRTTTEAMSAVIGGADSICVLPYNSVYEKATDFSARIALNQQHMLKNESYLDKVSDIAAGSYYIESLTDRIAEKVWEQFKTIESKGGFMAGLKSGFIQELIVADAERLQQEVKANKLVLVGVNKFQNTKEAIKPAVGRKQPETISSQTVMTSSKRPVRPIRLAEIFERERAASPNPEPSTPN